MLKALAVTLHIVAGFFIYAIGLLAFVDQPAAPKWGIVGAFSLPAVMFLCAGLAVNRFHRWKRDVGVVLLSGAGVTAFVALTLVCLLMDDEFKKMIQPEAVHLFSAYMTGIIVTLSTATLGVILLKTEK